MPDATPNIAKVAAKTAADFFKRAEDARAGKDLVAAYQMYLAAINADPKMVEAWNNLGVMLKDSNRPMAAVSHFRRAARLAPDNAHVLTNLGDALWRTQHYEEAEKHLTHAIKCDPKMAAAFHDRGLVFMYTNRGERGFQDMMSAYNIAPDHPTYQWGRAVAFLTLGKFSEGFWAYDARFDYKMPQVHAMPYPLWNGEDLTGKSLWISCEQGLGDSIQYVRFIPDVMKLAEHVIFDAHNELLRLFRFNLPGLEIRPLGTGLPSVDYHLPIMSLPARLGYSAPKALDPILSAPPGGPRIKPLPDTKVKVGIVWAGRPDHDNDMHRSCPLEWFGELSSLTGVQLWSLQAGQRSTDVPMTGMQALVTDLSGNLADMAVTASYIEQMDLVVGVDTSVVHLAGAMGKPVAVMLPKHAPDWRWMLTRTDSPWYPSMRLFRQRNAGDWYETITRVRSWISSEFLKE